MLCQEVYIVKYDVMYNTERPQQKKGELIVDVINNKSIFLERSDRTEYEITKSESFENKEISLIVYSENPRFNYFDHFKDSLISSETIIKTYTILERIPKIDWEITNKRKMIGEFEVTLAKTFFRGRKFEAWFSTDYPIRQGPWKFHGLPGLIIEVYDESRRFNWIANSVKLNGLLKDYEGYFDIVNDNNDNVRLDLKSYAKKRYGNNISTLIQSRLPRDAKIENKSIPRNGIEILFEWEEQD